MGIYVIWVTPTGILVKHNNDETFA